MGERQIEVQVPATSFIAPISINPDITRRDLILKVDSAIPDCPPPIRLHLLGNTIIDGESDGPISDDSTLIVLRLCEVAEFKTAPTLADTRPGARIAFLRSLASQPAFSDADLLSFSSLTQSLYGEFLPSALSRLPHLCQTHKIAASAVRAALDCGIFSISLRFHTIQLGQRHPQTIVVDFDQTETLARLKSVAPAHLRNSATFLTPAGAPVSLTDRAETYAGSVVWATKDGDFFFTDDTETTFRVHLRAVRDALQDLAFCGLAEPDLTFERCRASVAEIDATLRGILREYAADFDVRRRAIVAFRAAKFLPADADRLKHRFQQQFIRNATIFFESPDARLEELHDAVFGAETAAVEAAVIRAGRVPGVDEGAAKALLRDALAWLGLTRLVDAVQTLDAFLERAEGEFVLPFESVKRERIDKAITAHDREIGRVRRALADARAKQAALREELAKRAGTAEFSIAADDWDPLWMQDE